MKLDEFGRTHLTDHCPSSKPGQIIWFVGISGSGKTTLSNSLFDYLRLKNEFVERFDGDQFRAVSKNYDFSPAGRMKNLENVRQHLKVPYEGGRVCIASFITPYESMRETNRACFSNYLEIYCKCSLEVAMARDVKKLYCSAITGGIPNFTGISDLFEEPSQPDIVLHTDTQTVEDSLRDVLRHPAIKALLA